MDYNLAIKHQRTKLGKSPCYNIKTKGRDSSMYNQTEWARNLALENTKEERVEEDRKRKELEDQKRLFFGTSNLHGAKFRYLKRFEQI